MIRPLRVLGFLSALVVALGVVFIGGSAADAAVGQCPDYISAPAHGHTSAVPGSTDTTLCRSSFNGDDGESVQILYGFDYGKNTTGNLRAFVYVVPSDPRTHLQVDPLNLGTYDGVLTHAALHTSGGKLLLETPAINPCHTQPGATYLVGVHMAIRFADGLYIPVYEHPLQFADAGSAICS